MAECPHFDARAEKALLADAVRRGTPVLGICLGAQLLGEALGAAYDHSPHPEVGVFEVTLNAHGQADPLLSHLPRAFDVAHWHGDMPGVPAGAQVLASSAGCPRQIVRYTPRAYGFQCHPEMTDEGVLDLLQNCPQSLEHADKRYIQDAAALRALRPGAMHPGFFQFLDALTG